MRIGTFTAYFVVGALATLIVGTMLIAAALMPAEQRDPLEPMALIEAVGRCDQWGGTVEVMTDVRNRPIMVSCKVHVRSDEQP